MRIPSLLLGKLYVKGSLRNEGEGFRFTLKNVLAPGTATKLRALDVDGQQYPSAAVSLLLNGTEKVDAAAISKQRPLSFSLGQEVTVEVRGPRLSAGPHEILLSLLTKEVGELTVPIRDRIAS